MTKFLLYKERKQEWYLDISEPYTIDHNPERPIGKGCKVTGNLSTNGPHGRDSGYWCFGSFSKADLEKRIELAKFNNDFENKLMG